MARFSFDIMTLTDLISTRYFSVPRYQRSYAWDTDEVDDFWNDMNRAILEGGDYFLGNIVLTAGANEGSYEIIDGQQRIATTTILCAAMRDCYINEGLLDIANAIERESVSALDTSTFEKLQRIRLNAEDNTFYRPMIIERGECAPTIDSHKLIKGSYDSFAVKLAAIRSNNPSTWQLEFGKISRFLKAQAKIICVTTATDADAFTIFETLNDRGADLTIVDLLKNYLFSMSSTEIDSVQQLWIESRSILSEFQKAGEFLDFLRHFWSSVHGMTRERELFRSIKSKVTDKQSAVKLAGDIKSAAGFYCATLSEKAEFWKEYSSTDQNSVKLLLRLKLEQNRPLLMAILQHFHKDEIKKVLPALLSWSVRGLIGGVLGKGKAEVAYYDAAVKIRSGAIKTKDQLGTALSSLIPGDSLFSSTFEVYRTTNNSFARYLLLAIERKLQGEKQPEFVPNENVEQVNLEHLLPRNPKDNEWGEFKGDDVGFYSTRLGNMTLMQEGKNNKLGNKLFPAKKQVLASSTYKLNKEICLAADWTKVTIEKRQEQLSNLAPQVWPY
jgi:hypothetical protein